MKKALKNKEKKLKLTTLGFTLVELIAVIIILAVIASITYPTISNSIKNSKEKAYDVQVESIKEAAHKWAIDNATDLSETDTTRVNISDLISGGYITKTDDGKLYNPVDNSEMTGCVVINYSSDYNQYTYDYDSECKVLYTDNSGANAPELFDNMIPVYYDGSNWVYANITTDAWYDYDSKKWANAVVLNTGVTKNVGDIISMDDIAQMYVWIPRYKYTIFNADNSSVSEQEISITFESGTNSTGTVFCNDSVSGSGTSSQLCLDTYNDSIINGLSTYTHPAFTFGTTKLTGFWVGKFEVSGSTSSIKIKPNVSALVNLSVSNFYTSLISVSTQYNINANSFLQRNVDWGAVAYLTQSKYGKCDNNTCTEVWINPNSNYITGQAGSESYPSETTSTYDYNTNNGLNASTTGTIYGVYDMAGGSWEYVMGNMVNSSGTFYSGSSGFSTAPDIKYYDAYTYSTSDTSQDTQNRGKLGDATKEILSNYGNTIGGWYGDYSDFIYSSTPWFIRGGRAGFGSKAGIFCYSYRDGASASYISARVIIAKGN